MRTPVAAIEGYLGLAINPQTAQVDERAKNYILKAHESTQHLGHLFQDLLDTSKAEDGRLSNNPSVVNVAQFITDVAQGLEMKASDKGLKLSYKHLVNSEQLRHITPAYYTFVDTNHLREILNNLIENAIKYTVSGEVYLDVTGDDDNLIISVKDSGIGIPAEDMPHLFQKFYRIDNTDTREIGGTGLGLYLCRRLAEVIGGRVWAESVLHAGSTFYLQVPRMNNVDAAQQIQKQQEKIEQEKNRNNLNQVAAQAQTVQPQVTALSTSATKINVPPPRPADTMPKARALTPEQIAEYVKKQTALATAQRAARPSTINPPQEKNNQQSKKIT
jgi:signal transduction histidine kinase